MCICALCSALGVKRLFCFIYLPQITESLRACPWCIFLQFDCKFSVIKKDVKEIVCACVFFFCASHLGLWHDIEVVVIRGESHVSKDGPIVHCLNRLILESKRGSIYPDLEKKTGNTPHIRNTPHVINTTHIIYWPSLLVHSWSISGITTSTRYTYIKKKQK